MRHAGSESEGLRADFAERARLAVIWQELATPVRAIIDYQELIVEQARQGALHDLSPCLDKVLVAAQALSNLVEGLRDAGAAARTSDDGLTSAPARIRHDLRTPLNAIIGYSEMVIEDLDAVPGASGLRPDLESLLREARLLLDRIDTIVDLTRSVGALSGEQTGKGDAAEALVSDLLKALRPARERKTGETGRILVVDDNESNRDLLRRRLLQEGHSAVTVESGEAALEAVKGQSFDLILLDLLMPGMNGIEVLENLKADERWRDTPVIMISGLSEGDAVIRCIEAGAEDYLPKPFNPILLRARINAGLERKRWRDREREYLASLNAEKERSEALLRNILPDPIVVRLNAGETIIADRFEEASILFADIVGFTPTAASMSATQLVDRLNRIFSAFDALAAGLGVEKIKTIGDGYMAATGLPEARPDHAEVMVEFALAMLGALDRLNAAEDSTALELRIGIHSGPVVAGVIGRHKFIYDVWGDTVNTASRLESQGVPKRIHVSENVRAALKHKYGFEGRGKIALKGKGNTRTFLLKLP